MLSIIDYITLVIDSLLLYLYFFILMKKRTFIKCSALLDITIFSIVQIIYTIATSPLWGDSSTKATVIRLLLNCAINFGLSYLFKARIWLRLLTVISYMSLIAISEMLSAKLVTAFMNIPPDSKIAADDIFTIVPALMNIFLIFFIFFIGAITHRRETIKSIQYTLFLMITPSMSVIFAISPTIFEINYFAPEAYSTLLYCLVIINLSNFVLMKNTLLAEHLSIKTKQQEIQLNFQQSKYNQLSESYRNIRAFMHDAKKHFNYISYCVSEEKYDLIIPYASNSTKDLESRYCKVNTGNLAIDTFVSNLILQTEKRNINIDYKLKVDISDIPIDDYNLAIILGNLVDNSLNACKDDNNDMITVKIASLDNNFTIHFANTLHANDSSTIYESSELPIHGYGLANIKDITEQHSGFCIIDTDNNTFSVTIVIPY